MVHRDVCDEWPSKFWEARALIESKGQTYYKSALQSIRAALRELFGKSPVSLQQSSANLPAWKPYLEARGRADPVGLLRVRSDVSASGRRMR